MGNRQVMINQLIVQIRRAVNVLSQTLNRIDRECGDLLLEGLERGVI